MSGVLSARAGRGLFGLPVLLGSHEEIDASVIILAAGRITHLRCIKSGAGFQSK